MNRIAFAAVLVVMCVVVGLLVSPGVAEPTSARGTDAEKLIVLRKERRDVLQQALKLTEEGYRSGVVDFSSIPRISINLLNAELDLAPDHAARVVIREQIVERFKTIEKTAAQRVENAVADTTELLEARAARLQAEIELLHERANGK